jgi:hypothetical protein
MGYQTPLSDKLLGLFVFIANFTAGAQFDKFLFSLSCHEWVRAKVCEARHFSPT